MLVGHAGESQVSSPNMTTHPITVKDERVEETTHVPLHQTLTDAPLPTVQSGPRPDQLPSKPISTDQDTADCGYGFMMTGCLIHVYQNCGLK